MYATAAVLSAGQVMFIWPRAHTELGAFLRPPAMAERSLGRHIDRAIADREVLVGAAVPAAERLAAPLATHLDPGV